MRFNQKPDFGAFWSSVTPIDDQQSLGVGPNVDFYWFFGSSEK